MQLLHSILVFKTYASKVSNRLSQSSLSTNSLASQVEIIRFCWPNMGSSFLLLTPSTFKYRVYFSFALPLIFFLLFVSLAAIAYGHVDIAGRLYCFSNFSRLSISFSIFIDVIPRYCSSLVLSLCICPFTSCYFYYRLSVFVYDTPPSINHTSLSEDDLQRSFLTK